MTPAIPGICSPAELAQWLAEPAPPVVLDVRNPDEIAVVALPGSIRIPMREVPARIAELEPHRDKPIVVHCHHGMRSARVQGFLIEQGFESVYNLEGGIDLYAELVDPSLPRY